MSLYYGSYPPVYDPSQVDPGVTKAIANVVGQAMLEVRVGYFGICVNPDGGSFLCSNNASSLAGQVSVDQDPLNLIWVASTFKDSIVFPYLMWVSTFLLEILSSSIGIWLMGHMQNRRYNSRIFLLPPSRHLSGLAWRHWRERLPATAPSLPFATRFAGRSCPYLHRIGICTCVSAMAAHSFGGCQYHCSGSRQRQRPQRSWCDGNDIGLVWIRIAHYCDHWTFGHDNKYQYAGQIDWRRVMTGFEATKAGDFEYLIDDNELN